MAGQGLNVDSSCSPFLLCPHPLCFTLHPPREPGSVEIFFSAHGVPKSYVEEAGDPYKEEMEVRNSGFTSWLMLNLSQVFVHTPGRDKPDEYLSPPLSRNV